MLKPSSALFLGLESSGKSALFRGLTNSITGDEANFRGSTVVCRQCNSPYCECDLIDAPGIRVRDDTETSRLALERLGQTDRVVLVVRGTHLKDELETLLSTLSLEEKKSALVITFADKSAPELETIAETYRERLGIPVAVVDARKLDSCSRQKVAEAVTNARRMNAVPDFHALPRPSVRNPVPTLYESPGRGPLAALGSLLLMFALPVYAAYLFASALQNPLDHAVFTPLRSALEGLPSLWFALLAGDYGLFTLGGYSLLWALPVVLFLGISVAVGEESGLKDRITSALDPWLRWIGLSGRDLIPVLAGYGCNVVAVYQSRACSTCTRRSCVSMIAYGSACSYQMGATLSLFGASGHPGLFLPYLVLLFGVGAIHTRIWHGGLPRDAGLPLNERAFLQWPHRRAILWRVASVVKQFLFQAMPIFLLTCLATTLLHESGILAKIAEAMAPLLSWLHLPASVAPGILFSVLRKDGLLILNQGEGALLRELTTGQIFLLVYLASTLTACLVTLWTIWRELGWRTAWTLAGRQALTSVGSTLLLALLFHLS